MGVSNVYKDSNEAPIGTFDYLDLATEQGYKKYYLALATTSTTTTKFLSPQVISSDIGNPTYPPELSYGGNNVANALRYDYDYDLLFNTPQYIKGNMFFNFTLSAIGTGGGQSGISSIVINVYHVDGAGTETLLGTLTGPMLTSSTATKIYRRCCMQVDIADTHFRIGDKLRVNAQLWTQHSGVGNTIGGVYLDPTNIGVDSYDTDFFVFVPYKISL